MKSRLVMAAVAAVSFAVLAVAAAPMAVAAPPPYASIDNPGPALDVSPALLAASLSCTDGVRDAKRAPVLLLSSTTLDTDQNFGFNYENLFRQQGVPFCTSNSPTNPSNMGDLQNRAQYVTYAIRKMHEMAGRKIAVMGHSQGGMIMRWSLRFWPDTREMVDDVIGLAPDNQGTDFFNVTCVAPCAPSFWQQRTGSNFILALNSGQQTFPGISYTEIYSHTDEVVIPNFDDSGRSSVHGGGGDILNVAVQDVCPLDVADHILLGTLDPVAAALVSDALAEPGPADINRIDRAVCGRLVMPGTAPVPGLVGVGTKLAPATAAQIALYPRTLSEPPLAGYVYAH